MEDSAQHFLGPGFPKWRKKLNLILLLAFLLFVVGVFAPILTFEQLFMFSNQISIIGGLLQLLSEGHYILFGIIFLFSIVLPFLKMVLLFKVCNGKIQNVSQYEQLIGWIAKYGKWSMLDVFVAAVLIVTVKLRAIANVEVHYGLYAFAASVILTMLATWKVFSLTHPSIRRD